MYGPLVQRDSGGTLIRRANLYDALVGVLTLGRERRLRQAILAVARLEPGEHVLDAGCGTGTLALAAKSRVGENGTVDGVDASVEMIYAAREKAAGQGLAVRFETATVQELPFDGARFDVVLCTLVMHHLPREGRTEGVAEMFRVLRPGGRLLVVDLAPGGVWTALNPVALVHGRRSLDTVLEAEALIDRAGFVGISTGHIGFQNLGYVLAQKPPGA